MISIDSSNLHLLENYYSNTKCQLENLQNEVRFIADHQSPQINLKAFMDVLTNCEESVNISMDFLKLCDQTMQDKHFLQAQVANLREQNQTLMKQNTKLSHYLEDFQLNQRQNNELLVELQKQVNANSHQQQREIFSNELLAQLDRREAIYKIQLKHYESEFRLSGKKLERMQAQLSSLKEQLKLKIIQLQLAGLVLQDLRRQRAAWADYKQSKVHKTYSPSLNQSNEDLVCSKSSIQQILKNRKCSLMQDLVQSQVNFQELPFSTHLNKSIQILPEVLEEPSKLKQDFGNLQIQSRISTFNPCKQDEYINLIYSKIIKAKTISYGIQTQNDSLAKRIHSWLRMKIVTNRIKM